MEQIIGSSLRTGESVFQTIGGILTQIKSDEGGLQVSSNENFQAQALEDRKAALEKFENLIVPLGSFSADESKTFADELLKYGSEGARCLGLLIKQNKLPNFDLSKLSEGESKDFADKLLGCGTLDLPCFALLNFGKNTNFDLTSWQADNSKALADQLLEFGSQGALCLKLLIEKDKLPNLNLHNLSADESKAFADKLLGCSPKGAGCLKFLVEQNKLPNFDLSKLSESASKAFADKLLGCGSGGAEYLMALIEEGELPNLVLSDLSADESKKFTDKLLGCGLEGAEYLMVLIEEGRLPNLRLSNLSADESKAFADKLLGYGSEGAGCLRALIEEGRLPNLNLHNLSADESKAFADKLLGCGSEGAGCLRALIEEGRLPNLVLSDLSADESKAFADKLLGYGSGGVRCLRALIEEGRLPNLNLHNLSEGASKDFTDKLLGCGSEGAGCLRGLIEQNKLPNFDLSKLSEDEFLEFSKRLIECGPSGIEYYKSLVREMISKVAGSLENFPKEDSQELAELIVSASKFGIVCLKDLVAEGTLPNLELYQLNEEVLLQFDLSKLPQEQVTKLINTLLGSPPPNLSLFGRLIERNKGFFKVDSLFENLLSENHNTFALALAGGGPFGVSLLTQLTVIEGSSANPPKLDLGKLSPDESKTFADKLLGCSSGAEFLEKLIGESKLSCLQPQDIEPMRDRASRFKILHSILEGGIREAFFDRTDVVDDESWDGVYARLQTMPLREARGIWQTVVNKVAVDCFDAAGNVDIGKLRGWMEFFGNAEIFGTEPCCLIPHAKFACSQICVVLECLSDNRNGARDKLDAASHKPVSSYGQSILDVMFPGVVSPFNPATAILASLFTPHRQSSLLACTIHSTINEEIRNYPERLIEIYAQMLGGGNQFTSPGGYAFQLQPMENGFVTVDLKNGNPRGRDKIFEAIVKGDPSKIAGQKEAWQREGIGYVELASEADRYKLRLPIHNMNDVLFAHLFQASSFGNKKIAHETEFGTMLIYAGHMDCKAFPSQTSLRRPGFLDGIKALRNQALAQRQLGHRYMRVATLSLLGTHSENIDINALLAFDPNNMESGKAYVIGDRNWGGEDMSQDILRLAVRKVEDGNGGPPRHEIGTLRGGVFKNLSTTLFKIYTTGIEVHDAQFWEKFKP